MTTVCCALPTANTPDADCTPSRRRSKNGNGIESGRPSLSSRAISTSRSGCAIGSERSITALMSEKMPGPADPGVHRLLRLEHRGDGRRQAHPVGALIGELTAAFAGERIKTRVAAGFRCRPFGADPTALLEPVQGRVERPLLNLQDVTRD